MPPTPVKALTAAALLLSGCAGVPDYTTAKLVPKGSLQVTPDLTRHYVRLRGPASFDEADGDKTYDGSLSGYGATVVYGLSDDWNAHIQYGQLGSGDEGRFVRAAAKRGFDAGETAWSFGYGYYGAEFHEASMTVFLNHYYDRDLYYCLSPRLLLFLSANGVASVITVNNSLTFEFGERFFMSPQVGINPVMLLAGFIGINYGVAAGVTF